MDNFHRFTSIGRPLDPRYPTNLAILGLSLLITVSGAIYQIVSGTGALQGAAWGARAGFAVFLAWALARELDPDHDLAAFIGAGLALLSLPWIQSPAILALLWIIVATRVVNRVTGLPATLLDSVGVLGMAAWLSLRGNWMYGLLTALVFFLDSRLSPAHRRQLAFAATALVMTAGFLIYHRDLYREGSLSPAGLVATLGITVLFLPVMAASRRIRSLTDATEEPLKPARVRAAQIIALLAGLQIAFWQGDTGVTAFLPLWAAVLGVSLYRIILSLRLGLIQQG